MPAGESLVQLNDDIRNYSNLAQELPPDMIILDLVQNIALLVALAATYRVFLARFSSNSLRFRLLMGLLFGGVGILGMMTPVTLLPGVIYDGRSVILSSAGLFGGPLVALIAGVITTAYRLYLGGAGATAGVGVIIMAAGLGALYHVLRKRGKLPVNGLVLLGFGVLVHALMLAIQQIIPGGAGRLVLEQLGLPIMVAFPLATVLICLFFLDAENQIRDRKALVESEAALLKAQQVAHVGSWTWYIQENRVVWSDEMYRIFGIQKSKFTGILSDVIANSIHPDDRAVVEEGNRLVVVEGKPQSFENRIVRPDGTVRVVYAEAGELVRDFKGSPATLTGIVQDITERRAAENELRESETRYRNLILHLPDAIFINHDNRVVLVNEACLKLFGAEKESDMLGKTPYDLFHPDFHEQIHQRISLMKGQHSPVQAAEEKIVRLDGQVVDVDVVAAPFMFHGANDIHVIMRDITERKKMEQALVESHQMLTGLAEQVPGVIYTYKLDPDGASRFPYASPGMWDIYEATPEEVRKDATVVFGRLHPEDYDFVSEAIFESARSLNLFHVEYRVILPQQGLRWRSSYAKPTRTEDGGTLWYGIIMDITDRMMAENKIGEQLAELRRWRSVMLGRETRMIELKQEVNNLLLQAGRPPRYMAEIGEKGLGSIEDLPPGGIPPSSEEGAR